MCETMTWMEGIKACRIMKIEEQERRSPRQEAVMTIEATPNEVIALHMVIHLYSTYAEKPTEEYRIVEQLLLRFRQRLVEHLPTTVMPVVREEVSK